MAGFFDKPLDELDADDIQGLIDAEVAEGQTFEIKRDLAGENNRPDSWHTMLPDSRPRKSPDRASKVDLFKEVIAFANAEGGWLVLGVDETNDHPKRAAALHPLPDCHELAARLQQTASDLVDPPLPSARWRGIEIGANAAAGVVVCRVPPAVL